MVDSIEYELTEWELREVWKCQGECGRYRHRQHIKGALAAICCGKPAKLIDRYEQPKLVSISESVRPPHRSWDE